MLNPLISLGYDLIKRLFPDKDKQKELDTRIQELEISGEMQELTDRYNSILEEQKSKDKWISRARPTFLYVMYLMILMCIPMGVLSIVNQEWVHIIENGMKGWLDAIPDPLWMLFGSGYLGYSITRSLDKRKK